MPRETTIDSKSDLLQNHFKHAIESKRRGSGVLLQYDNTRTHTECATGKQMTNVVLDCLSHNSYSPDLAQCVWTPQEGARWEEVQHEGRN